MKIEIKTGQKIGEFLYEGPSLQIGQYSQKKIPLKCKCGRIKNIRLVSASLGKSKTCGECTSFILKRGTKFGSLEYDGPDVSVQGESQKKLPFLCSCGRKKQIRIFTIMRGRAKKCGSCKSIILKSGTRLKNLTYDGQDVIIYLRSNKRFIFKCDIGHSISTSYRRAINARCKQCSTIILNHGDKFGNFTYSGESTITIFPWSKKKIKLECRCGIIRDISISSITCGDVISCSKCYQKAFEWFKNYEPFLKTLKCPIQPVQIPEGGIIFLEVINNKVEPFRAICPACKKEYKPRFSDVRRGRCITCGCTSKRISRPSIEISDYIKSLGLEVIQEYEIGGRFFDIYIPSANLLIEINGIRWHSKDESKKRDMEKYAIAIQNNIPMMCIFEDEWRDKKNIISIIIRNRLRLLSPQSYRINKCEIKEINHVEAKKFYDQFHYLGGRPAIYHYGAFIAGRLMACISFTRPSRQSNYDYELSRMAADPSFRIHGIWSKMMLIFVKAVEPKKIVTFSDNRLFAGGVYEKMGFKYDGDVKPDYYWVIGDRRLHKSALRKPKGETRTENEIRTLEGYKKIWDLGKKRWVMDVHHPS